jgi:hypothetical protein
MPIRHTRPLIAADARAHTGYRQATMAVDVGEIRPRQSPAPVALVLRCSEAVRVARSMSSIQASGVAEMTLGAVVIIGALFSPADRQLAFMFMKSLYADEGNKSLL